MNKSDLAKIIAAAIIAGLWATYCVSVAIECKDAGGKIVQGLLSFECIK